MKRLFLTIFFSILFCGQAFAEGNIIDRWATDAEVTAQTRDDKGITPASIPYIVNAPGGAIIVGGSGSDYTDLSDAVDAATEGDTILVYPGTYTDSITYAVNKLSIIGMGSRENTILQAANATVVSFGATTGGIIENFGIKLTAPTADHAMVYGTTGSFVVKSCKSELTCTNNLSQANQPSIGYVNGAGTLKFQFGKAHYTHSGTTTTGLKMPFKTADGGVIRLRYMREIDINGSGSALATTVGLSSSGAGYVVASGCSIDVDDDTATFVVGLGYLTAGTSLLNEFIANIVHVYGADNNAYGIYVTDATVDSEHNHIHVECSGSGTEYSFVEAGSGTINSTCDAVIAPGGHSGNIVIASSPAAGDQEVSGELRYAKTPSRTVTDANATLTSADFGKSVRMSSASDYIAFLPSAGASDDGARLRIVKTGAGKVTVDAADSDLINDSGAGDTIYNNSAETYAYIDLEYAHAIVTWVACGTGTWTTTN